MATRNYDYRTEGTKKREALHEKLAKLYVTYRSCAAPGVSDAAIFNRIAAEVGVSNITVRNVCLEKGVATKKS